MRINFLLLILCFTSVFLKAQEGSIIAGRFFSKVTSLPLANVEVRAGESELATISDVEGRFILNIAHHSDAVLVCSLSDYLLKRIPVNVEDADIDLGDIFLDPDIKVEKMDNLINLTERDLFNENETISTSVGLLQASRDIFLNRAAFDFGQAFFRVRGYDSRNGHVTINGINMNNHFDGRPRWSDWGGLNDVVRNQEFTNGLAASEYVFGGVLGNTNIDLRPSQLRRGFRMTSSVSNRTYAGRLMATYNSGLANNGLAYAISGSRRWAPQGYIDGTVYDAFSFYGAIEYQLTNRSTFLAAAIIAKNRRGRSTAITEEVFELAGNRYNPHWGPQDGNIRNARVRIAFEPIVMLNHFFTSDKLRVTSGIAYQFGNNSQSRLGYYNAPNPDPTYYRYLPSFYINNPIGADFTNADLARQGFSANPQINWQQLYLANANTVNDGRAAYLFYYDRGKSSKFYFNSVVNYEISSNLKFDFGLGYQKQSMDNFAEVEDLLGADFHRDIDPFSDTKNDINGKVNKEEGDVFGYNFKTLVYRYNGLAQLRFSYPSWNMFFAGMLSHTSYQRFGLFQNERFLENSFGNSNKINFANYGIKGGLGYRITGRHWLKLHSALLSRAPILQNVFVNPRESNEVVTNIKSELISSVDLNYFIRLPSLTGRISGFYSRFENTTDINFFFVESGFGSDFVQEVVTDLDKLHLGLEVGIEYQASSSVKLSAAVNFGKYVYASDPSVSINFDTSGQEEPIDPQGSINLGIADIKGYKLAQGPQKAISIGVEYRDPKYWWVGATANYLANNYANISTITRTQSFYLNPDTGERFVDATEENVAKLLAQQELDDFHLLNLVGGKSWLINQRYISVFASINNVFDANFRTGGYEQSRNGNFGQLQQDKLRNNPTFAPKYWYGYGRTYFLNLAVSF